MRLAAASVSLMLGACSLMPSTPVTTAEIPVTETPYSWPDVIALASPPPGQKHSYGPKPQQFGILRHPGGSETTPVAVLIHGGCWLNQFDLNYFEHWADWLTDQGFATWNIEYRRLGDAGAGWPGTLTDVADAIDHLHVLARSAALDLSNVTLIGHSAGGQLALWSASRDSLSPRSDLFRPNPVPVDAVIGLAAITDLDQYRHGPKNSCHASVEALLGGTPDTVAARYAAASPAQRLPTSTPISTISGSQDSIVSPGPVREFVAAVNSAGGQAQHIELPGAGHFDTGVPIPASMAAMSRALRWNRRSMLSR